YSSLSGDLSDANYGSQRGGLLSEREEWKSLQRWYATQFHRRVFRVWLKWALTTGAVRIPPARMLDVGAHSWMPRGWDWIDPLKDIQAAVIAIAAGLDSRTRLAAARGLSFEENLANLDREQQLAKLYNV